MKAIYPCSFDPIHNGHIEVIQAAAEIYEHLFLYVINYEEEIHQNTLITRGEIVEKAISNLGFDNITVVVQNPGIQVPNAAKKLGATTLIRGTASRAIDASEQELTEKYLEINDDLIINYIVTPTFKITSKEIIKLNQSNKSIKNYVPKIIEKDVVLKWR